MKFFLKCNQNCLKTAGNPRDMRRFQVRERWNKMPVCERGKKKRGEVMTRGTEYRGKNMQKCPLIIGFFSGLYRELSHTKPWRSFSSTRQRRELEVKVKNQ